MNISEVELEYRNTPDESWKRVNFIKAEVLDKIKAEVINLTSGATPERIWNVDVLEIIDKCRMEGEEA